MEKPQSLIDIEDKMRELDNKMDELEDSYNDYEEKEWCEKDKERFRSWEDEYDNLWEQEQKIIAEIKGSFFSTHPTLTKDMLNSLEGNLNMEPSHYFAERHGIKSDSVLEQFLMRGGLVGVEHLSTSSAEKFEDSLNWKDEDWWIEFEDRYFGIARNVKCE